MVGVAYDDPSNTYGAALIATFNKGKTATYAAGRKLPSSGNSLGSDDYTFMHVPGYALVDLTAYYRVSKNVRLSGGIYNLTDRKYWDYQTSRNIEAPTSNSASDINYYNQQLAVSPAAASSLASTWISNPDRRQGIALTPCACLTPDGISVACDRFSPPRFPAVFPANNNRPAHGWPAETL